MQLTTQSVEADVTSDGELDNVAGLGYSSKGETLGAQPDVDPGPGRNYGLRDAPRANPTFHTIGARDHEFR